MLGKCTRSTTENKDKHKATADGTAKARGKMKDTKVTALGKMKENPNGKAAHTKEAAGKHLGTATKDAENAESEAKDDRLPP